MQLETLEFRLRPRIDFLKGAIMLAVKRKASLLTVVAKVDYVEDCSTKATE
jgi:hypothetical protein